MAGHVPQLSLADLRRHAPQSHESIHPDTVEESGPAFALLGDGVAACTMYTTREHVHVPATEREAALSAIECLSSNAAKYILKTTVGPRSTAAALLPADTQVPVVADLYAAEGTGDRWLDWQEHTGDISAYARAAVGSGGVGAHAQRATLYSRTAKHADAASGSKSARLSTGTRRQSLRQAGNLVRSALRLRSVSRGSAGSHSDARTSQHTSPCAQPSWLVNGSPTKFASPASSPVLATSAPRKRSLSVGRSSVAESARDADAWTTRSCHTARSTAEAWQGGPPQPGKVPLAWVPAGLTVPLHVLLVGPAPGLKFDTGETVARNLASVPRQQLFAGLVVSKVSKHCPLCGVVVPGTPLLAVQGMPITRRPTAKAVDTLRAAMARACAEAPQFLTFAVSPAAAERAQRRSRVLSMVEFLARRHDNRARTDFQSLQAAGHSHLHSHSSHVGLAAGTQGSMRLSSVAALRSMLADAGVRDPAVTMALVTNPNRQGSRGRARTPGRDRDAHQAAVDQIYSGLSSARSVGGHSRFSADDETVASESRASMTRILARPAGVTQSQRLRTDSEYASAAVRAARGGAEHIDVRVWRLPIGLLMNDAGRVVRVLPDSPIASVIAPGDKLVRYRAHDLRQFNAQHLRRVFAALAPARHPDLSKAEPLTLRFYRSANSPALVLSEPAPSGADLASSGCGSLFSRGWAARSVTGLSVSQVGSPTDSVDDASGPEAEQHLAAIRQDGDRLRGSLPGSLPSWAAGSESGSALSSSLHLSQLQSPSPPKGSPCSSLSPPHATGGARSCQSSPLLPPAEEADEESLAAGSSDVDDRMACSDDEASLGASTASLPDIAQSTRRAARVGLPSPERSAILRREDAPAGGEFLHVRLQGARAGVSMKGPQVVEVIPGGASFGVLAPGDVVCSINGRPVSNVHARGLGYTTGTWDPTGEWDQAGSASAAAGTAPVNVASELQKGVPMSWRIARHLLVYEPSGLRGPLELMVWRPGLGSAPPPSPGQASYTDVTSPMQREMAANAGGSDRAAHARNVSGFSLGSSEQAVSPAAAQDRTEAADGDAGADGVLDRQSSEHSASDDEAAAAAAIVSEGGCSQQSEPASESHESQEDVTLQGSPRESSVPSPQMAAGTLAEGQVLEVEFTSSPLGIKLVSMTLDLQAHCVVSSVVSGSPAAKAGVQPGLLLHAVDETEVGSLHIDELAFFLPQPDSMPSDAVPMQLQFVCPSVAIASQDMEAAAAARGVCDCTEEFAVAMPAQA